MVGTIGFYDRGASFWPFRQEFNLKIPFEPKEELLLDEDFDTISVGFITKSP